MTSFILKITLLACIVEKNSRQVLSFIVLASLMMFSVNSVAISNKVVAVVNDGVITESELNLRIKRINGNPSKAEAAKINRLGSEQELRAQVLKLLVEEAVLVHRAKLLGLKISPNEIENAMQTLYESMSIDPKDESNKAAINSLRKEVESELLVSRLVRVTLARNINVSSYEIDEMLLTQAGKDEGKSYKVLQLFVKTKGDEDEVVKGKMLAKVQGWRDDLANGTTMATIMKENESSDVAPLARDLSWKTTKQLPELFISELDKMKRGDTSVVISSPNAFHVLQLFDVRGGEEIVEKRTAQHILISAKTKLERQQAVEKMNVIRDSIINGGNFAEIATKRSDDPGSAAKGGDLGAVAKGDTVPEFEETLFSLSVGEVSQPVVTKYGVHILKLNKIEQEDISQKFQRDRVAEKIKRKKISQQYPAWLSDLVSKAYITYF